VPWQNGRDVRTNWVEIIMILRESEQKKIFKHFSLTYAEKKSITSSFSTLDGRLISSNNDAIEIFFLPSRVIKF
jgi:hypothetical protein